MKLCYETSTAISGGTLSLLDGHKIGNRCNLTARSKTDARKRRFAPLLAPFNANVRPHVTRALRKGRSVSALGYSFVGADRVHLRPRRNGRTRVLFCTRF